MKTWMAVVAAAALTAAAFGQERMVQPMSARSSDAWMRQHDITGDAVAHFPGLGDFDVFEYALGVEAGYRHWFTDIVGAGVGLGLENWSAGGASRNWRGRVSGDMTVIPLSVSGFLRAADVGELELIGFVALEYAITISDLTVTRDGEKDDVSLDNALNGRIGLEVALPLTPDLSLTGQAGFQFNLWKADAEALGGGLMDLDMQSFFIGIGVAFAF